ncbi:helix-turn-helix transcriptional regulator [Cochlodiniinecator piscidefendens]|uniref:helix-turn-helix transcriptional regulator n=1 Tax=Cochlodiniinecator piscidefendens TaxID=2715756 RepID=UPI00140CA711|nr:helix-turn-helix transcriptional regulator [Cochlodiniinecator piscidefendens]
MKHKPSQSLNHLIDAADALLSADDPDDAWLSSVKLVEQSGGNALNVIEVDRGTGALLWARSSMNPEWLEDYFSQSFLDLDPLVLSAHRGDQLSRMVNGRVQTFTDDSKQADDLSDQIVQWGYHTIDFYAFATDKPSTFKGLAFSYETERAHRMLEQKLLCGLISSVVFAPSDVNSAGATPFFENALTSREKDVLRYLAAGLRNDAIAWKMRIAEITVRSHTKSARRKLGASTREQAIALAIRSGQLEL